MVRARSGFNLVEMLVVTAIFVFVLYAFFNLLTQAQSNFFSVDASIDIRNSLRLASEKMALELRNSGYKNGVAQFSLLAGQGTGGSDIIRFSVPILNAACSQTDTLLTTSGVPANWGAPLTWGCSCINYGNACGTYYTYIEYSINASSVLQRLVLNNALAVVSGGTTNIGNYIVNLKTSLSPDGHVITFTLTGQKLSAIGRIVTATYTNEVLLNNLNG